MIIKIVLFIILGVYIYFQYRMYINTSSIVNMIEKKSNEELEEFIQDQIKFNTLTYFIFGVIILLFI